MSLTALRHAGALGDSIDGLKMLAKIGGNRKLPIPRWSVYSQPNNWTADDRKMLKEAQNMLRELGPTLVKEGKLSP